MLTASLLQQLQHVLQPWDALDDVGCATLSLTSAEKSDVSRGEMQKNLFTLLVDGDGGSVSNRTARSYAVPNRTPLLADMKGPDSGSDTFITLPLSEIPHLHRREVVTKLEMSRAALALFTSNSGAYRAVLRKTLGFLFELVDQLMQENVQLRENSMYPQQNRSQQQELGQVDKAEVAAVHEKMRIMEDRMAKLVEESSLQRDHLKAEIAACHEREKKLEMLLEHQMMLNHPGGFLLDGTHVIGKGRRDADYVRQLILRAGNEKAVDDLQQELKELTAEQEQLRKRTQELLELNGMYARQSITLSTRLSILGDYNVALAVEFQKVKNDILVERGRSEKLRLDLVALRNMVMASFSNRNRDMRRQWVKIRSGQADDEPEATEKVTGKDSISDEGDVKSNDSSSPTGAVSFVRRKPSFSTSEAHPLVSLCARSVRDSLRASLRASVCASMRASVCSSRRASVYRGAEDTITGLEPLIARPMEYGTNDLGIIPYQVPGLGGSSRIPDHLRTTEAVEVLCVDPVFVERHVFALLCEWYSCGMEDPLDCFAQRYFMKLFQDGDSPVKGKGEKDPLDICQQACKGQLKLSYAFDRISRSDRCGSLTYAYGLVTRRQVSKDLIRMIQLDTSMILAIFRFLDLKQNEWVKKTGIISVAEFTSVVSAMYPSYPESTIQELVDAAVGLGGNAVELPGYICYDVLLPERLFLGSETMYTSNDGVTPNSHFLYLFHYFILNDVEESWLRIEDSFFSLQTPSGLVSERMLFYQAFNELPAGPSVVWTPALQAVLSSWDVLKVNRGPLEAMEAIWMSLTSSLEFLRQHALPRRGTHQVRESSCAVGDEGSCKMPSEDDSEAENPMPKSFYSDVVKLLDPERHAVWGPPDVHAGNNLRHMSNKEDLSTAALLERLVSKYCVSEESHEDHPSDFALVNEGARMSIEC
uniref:Uncharacterized protein TCIL3000_11_16780 n=1 Tax=Trypanosoma congolense (strain IL3000) TaxID=1068625 RepID=G0V3E1_TRYCI|nr:unnamed protein product [Trypanosoma congolense IL3000]